MIDKNDDSTKINIKNKKEVLDILNNSSEFYSEKAKNLIFIRKMILCILIVMLFYLPYGIGVSDTRYTYIQLWFEVFNYVKDIAAWTVIQIVVFAFIAIAPVSILVLAIKGFAGGIIKTNLPEIITIVAFAVQFIFALFSDAFIIPVLLLVSIVAAVLSFWIDGLERKHLVAKMWEETEQKKVDMASKL